MIALASILLLLQSHFERAQSLLREQKIEEARREVEAALRDSPNSVPALLLHGRLAMAENRFDVARQAFTKAVELAPSSAQTHFLLGFFHYVDNDFVQARTALEQSRKLKASDPQATLFLAMTYDGLAQPLQAEPLFKEALRHPTVEVHVAYARMLVANGRMDDAQAQITKALAMDSVSRDALYEQARLQLERGEITTCIANAEKALSLPGGGVAERSIHFLLSRAYTRAGEKQKAELHRQRFEAIPPRLVR